MGFGRRFLTMNPAPASQKIKWYRRQTLSNMIAKGYVFQRKVSRDRDTVVNSLMNDYFLPKRCIVDQVVRDDIGRHNGRQIPLKEMLLDDVMVTYNNIVSKQRALEKSSATPPTQFRD